MKFLRMSWKVSKQFSNLAIARSFGHCKIRGRLSCTFLTPSFWNMPRGSRVSSMKLLIGYGMCEWKLIKKRQTSLMINAAIIFRKPEHRLLQGDRVSKRRWLFQGEQFNQGKQRDLRRRRWPALIVSITFAPSKMIPDVKLHYFHLKHALH